MKNTMRTLTKISTLFLLGLVVLSSFSCKTTTEKKADATTEVTAAPQLKLSLAQWSIHRMIFEDNVDPYTFAQKAHDWGFEGLEYVSALYYKELQAANFSKEAMDHFVEKSNAEAKKYGMTNVLIMIDGQGNLATTDAQERKEAVENHYKWVDAAAAMGCHSIRVNLSGSTDLEIWSPAAVDGLTQLGTYAADKNINIIVENHGGLSSNADYLTAVMAEVNMDNVGTLPDFGNFCIRKSDPTDWGSECAEEYDRYDGVEKLMKYAKAVSAKSHDFNEAGDEIHSDYYRIMKSVVDAGYTGFVGVEYEGNVHSEEEGILLTRDLLKKIID
jgi:sugar phosphate isomerase/epimerase